MTRRSPVEVLRRHGVRGTLTLLRARALTRLRQQLVRPVRVPPDGLWMIAWPDVMGQHVKSGRYDVLEQRFVALCITEGATFVDVGAHAGFYTLLAAHHAGEAGRVIAFEPSGRERRRLQLNLRLNRLRNVTIVSAAVGSKAGEQNLYLVRSVETGFSSLRPPGAEHATGVVKVPVVRLDDALDALGVHSIDFVKMDIEGGELAALEGAERLLDRVPRPVVLCEVADARTKRWGYQGIEIVRHLDERGFSWFRLDEREGLVPIDREGQYHENLVAVPHERLDATLDLARASGL